MNELLLTIAGFLLIIFSAKEIGQRSLKIGLPLISGFILTGVACGPYVLGFFTRESAHHLILIDELALPFIALAAGAEIHFAELRNSLKKILRIISCIVGVVIVLGTTALYFLSNYIPFTSDFTSEQIFGVAVLGSIILAATSPSSTIAVIKELRAKGKFTQLALGITVFMDTIVILVFAIGTSFVDSVFHGSSIEAAFLAHVIGEICIDVILGILIGLIVKTAFALPVSEVFHSMFTLIVGYLVFHASGLFANKELPILHFKLFGEPLLICMVAGMYVSNFTRFKTPLLNFVESAAPVIFIIFFTAVGIELDLGVLKESWKVIGVIILVRLFAMYSGCFIGSKITRASPMHSRYLGLCFITQAGVSLSLAKDVGVSFPAWGNEFASLFVGIIVTDTLIGPGFFKLALHKVKEAHTRGAKVDGAGEKAVIFGVENQSLALAKQLSANGWKVTVANLALNPVDSGPGNGVEIKVISDISKETLKDLGLDTADTIIVMLDNDTNFKICEAAYENFGTKKMVTLLQDRGDAHRFYELGALIVDPATAIVNLLDHFVRSPSAAALLLGQEANKDVIEFGVRNENLHGLALRDLHLPSDCLVLSVRRKGNLVLSHGYTRLRIGDEVTVIGSKESLNEVAIALG
ncbi:MAG: cation:proton antiporter [Deltaproteobacteria bacterium]|nr:cation:proton antiporter [Deltaproteobacteria bacterium]